MTDTVLCRETILIGPWLVGKTLLHGYNQCCAIEWRLDHASLIFV